MQKKNKQFYLETNKKLKSPTEDFVKKIALTLVFILDLMVPLPLDIFMVWWTIKIFQMLHILCNFNTNIIAIFKDFIFVYDLGDSSSSGNYLISKDLFVFNLWNKTSISWLFLSSFYLSYEVIIWL